MGYKNFLIPVATAVAALFTNASQAAIPPSAPTTESLTIVIPKLTEKSHDPIVQRMRYPIEGDAHELLMRRPVSGPIYAQHVSHSSHWSHASHRSHRSGS